MRTSNARRWLVLAALLGLAAACSSGSGTSAPPPTPPEPDAIAVVGDTEITTADFDRYAGVFRDHRTGVLQVTPAEVLEALVVQQLVLDYADAHDIEAAVPDDGHGHAEELTGDGSAAGERISAANPNLTPEQAAENVRRFALFSTVRDRVVGAALPPAAPGTAYDPARVAEEDAVWEEWIAEQRAGVPIRTLVADADLAALARPRT